MTTVPLLCLLLFAPVAQGQDRFEPLKKSARSMIEALDKGEWGRATSDFDATMTKALPSDKLESLWKQLGEQVGPLEKILGLRTEEAGSLDVVFVQCQFKKIKLDIKVNFDRKGKVTGLFFVPAKGDYKFEPPPYVKKDQFTEKEVKVGQGDKFLPGTLTLPKGDGPFPAVVLLPGSGPHDRDETLGPNKPLRDLAWGLAMHGVASLRYEKRTSLPEKMVGQKFDRFTLKEEVIDDALAAVFLLRNHTAIDRKKVFVAGHSLGAMATPRVLTLEPAVAGGILLAGNQRPLPDLALEQFDYLEKLADGKLTAEQKKQFEKLRAEIGQIKDPKIKDAPPDKVLFGAPAAYWLSLKEYDQAATAAKLKQPLLILQGERDYQVTMTDFDGWKKALAEKKNVEFRSYPKLNHLFMEGEGKSSPGEYGKPGHVAPAVIEDVATWVKKQ